MLIQIAFILVFLYGGVLLYSGFFVQATARSIQAVSKSKAFVPGKRYAAVVDSIAKRLSGVVRLSDYKRGEYTRMLEVLDMNQTPEEYTAKTIAAALLFFSLGLLIALITHLLALFFPQYSVVVPLFVLLAPIFAIVIYISKFRTLKSKYAQRKTDIELELPKLCSVINSRLQSTSNVPSILTDFLPIANTAMAAELIVTLADMKTGNVETALRRFEGRISSPKVSDVVRGLISVQNGDDMRVFFQSKQYQFNNDYITIKKKSILQRPMKLSLPGMLAFVFFLLVVMYPLLTGMQKMITDFM